MFLDCTGNTQYSSNTGYYTRLCYERSLLDFDRQRDKPHPRVFDHKDEDRLKRRNYVPASGATQQAASTSSTHHHSRSPSQQSDSRQGGYSDSQLWEQEEETVSDVDPVELETILSYDYEKAVSKCGKKPPQEDEDSVEKWYEECEEQLRTMQHQYRMLQRFLNKIDRKLGMRTRFQLNQSQTSTSIEPLSEMSHISLDNQDLQDQEQHQEEHQEEQEQREQEATNKLIIELSGNKRARRKTAATIESSSSKYNEQSTDDDEEPESPQLITDSTKKRRKRRR